MSSRSTVRASPASTVMADHRRVTDVRLTPRATPTALSPCAICSWEGGRDATSLLVVLRRACPSGGRRRSLFVQGGTECPHNRRRMAYREAVVDRFSAG